MFPIEHVLVVKLEEYSKDPATAMVNIFRFLDLSKFICICLPCFVDELESNYANPRTHRIGGNRGFCRQSADAARIYHPSLWVRI